MVDASETSLKTAWHLDFRLQTRCVRHCPASPKVPEYDKPPPPIAHPQIFPYLCYMRLLKPIVSLLMALMVSVTSLGLTVSTHSCDVSGVSEMRIGHLKACCKMADGDGFRAEPCCKVTANLVKLATVSRPTLANPLDGLAPVVYLPAPVTPTISTWTAIAHSLKRPPESPPLPPRGNDSQALFAQFLI